MGSAGWCRRALGARWSDRVLRSPGGGGAPQGGIIFIMLLMCSRGENLAVRINLPLDASIVP